ncbi:MAG: GDP-mannose 4,6-dehydratase [Bacteroidales bacterium]
MILLNLIRIISDTKPDEIYNLTAMSHVAVSFDTPGVCCKRRWNWNPSVCWKPFDFLD